MSIVIDGVTLPDLPADVLAQYPYVVIEKVYATENGTVTVKYQATFSVAPMVCMTRDVYLGSSSSSVSSLYAGIEYCLGTTKIGYANCIIGEGDTQWGNLHTGATYHHMIFVGVMDYGSGMTLECIPIWSNYTIYMVSAYKSVSGADAIYTLSGGTYVIGSGAMVSIDDYPPIPDDLSYSYPYVSIGEMTYRALDTNQLLATLGTILIKTTQPLVYIPMELIPGHGTMFVALTDGSISYECDTGGTTWENPSESNQEVMIPEIIVKDETENIKACIEPKAANYDVKEIDLVGSEAAGELVFSRTVISASGTPPIIPEPSYSISRFDLLKLARKLRQINGTTNGMSVSEMGYATSRVTVIEDAEGMVF